MHKFSLYFSQQGVVEVCNLFNCGDRWQMTWPRDVVIRTAANLKADMCRVMNIAASDACCRFALHPYSSEEGNDSEEKSRCRKIGCHRRRLVFAWVRSKKDIREDLIVF